MKASKDFFLSRKITGKICRRNPRTKDYFNDLIEQKADFDKAWTLQYTKRKSYKVYTCLCNALWYVVNSHALFMENGCPTSNLFQKFREYRYIIIITSENITKINLLLCVW